jgi:hypothetical protein
MPSHLRGCAQVNCRKQGRVFVLDSKVAFYNKHNVWNVAFKLKGNVIRIYISVLVRLVFLILKPTTPRESRILFNFADVIRFFPFKGA